jgi:hypothetical protein
LNQCLMYHMALAGILPYSFQKFVFAMLFFPHTASQRLCSPYHSHQCLRLSTTIGWLPSHKHPAMYATIAPILPSCAPDNENGKDIILKYQTHNFQ